MDKLKKLMEEISPELREELCTMIERFIKEKKGKKGKGFTYKWAGALSNLKEKYTVEELEELALKWRK